MLDLEKLAESGDLFDGHYRLIRPLSTDGATTDIWLAVDMNTIEKEDSLYNCVFTYKQLTKDSSKIKDWVMFA